MFYPRNAFLCVMNWFHVVHAAGYLVCTLIFHKLINWSSHAYVAQQVWMYKDSINWFTEFPTSRYPLDFGRSCWHNFGWCLKKSSQLHISLAFHINLNMWLYFHVCYVCCQINSSADVKMLTQISRTFYLACQWRSGKLYIILSPNCQRWGVGKGQG